MITYSWSVKVNGLLNLIAVCMKLPTRPIIARNLAYGGIAWTFVFLTPVLDASLTKAADEVGVAERIVNTVTGTVETETRTVETGAAVFRSELLIASSDSRGEISLADGSKVIVAENASVELDDFVIAGNTIEAGTIRITKGAFRFISNGEHSPIKFETPLSSIGVRGTVFDLYVAPQGQTRLVVLSGSVRACTLTGRCIVTNRGCDIVEIRGPEEIEEMAFLRSRKRSRQEEAEQFHLTENQRQFKAAYRAHVGGCNGRAAEEFAAGTVKSNADPGPEPPAPVPTPSPGRNAVD